MSVDYVAKRLINCGFPRADHVLAVAGTLMIEPTESEPKAEVDRFCAAMLAIADEAHAIEKGRTEPGDNPLMRHRIGPTTASQHVIRRGAFRVDKSWAPVDRVDNRVRQTEPGVLLPASGELPGGGGVGHSA